MVALMLTLALAPAPGLNILFVGNSHTGSNNLPALVKRLLDSDGSGRPVSVGSVSVVFLEDAASSPTFRQQIASGTWNVAVLQGAKLSSSHKYDYDHKGTLQALEMTKAAGIKTYIFAEWPRRDWKETEWILGQYKPMAVPTKAKIIPVGRAWDAYIQQTGADLWAPDGNHANLAGSFLAACTIAAWLSPDGKAVPSYVPSGIDPKAAALMKSVALRLATPS